MDTHQAIDQRSLRLAQEVARRVDADNALLVKVRAWTSRHSAPAIQEWKSILEQPWPDVRAVLLSPGPEGQRLRQSSPFVGILTPQERWQIYRESPPV